MRSWNVMYARYSFESSGAPWGAGGERSTRSPSPKSRTRGNGERMKLGLFAINYGTCADPDSAIEIARYAESAGLESVWTGEHKKPSSGPEYERKLLRTITEINQKQLAALQPTSARSTERTAGRRHLGQVLAARRALVKRANEDTGTS